MLLTFLLCGMFFAMKKSLLILVCLGVAVGCGNSSKNEEIEQENKRLKAELENKQSGANKMEWNRLLDKIHAKLMRFRDEEITWGDTIDEDEAEEKRHVSMLEDLTLDAKTLAADLKASGFPEYSQVNDIIEEYRKEWKRSVLFMKWALWERRKALANSDFKAAVDFNRKEDVAAREAAVKANAALERLKTLQN